MEEEDDIQWQTFRLIRSGRIQSDQDAPANLHVVVHWWMDHMRRRNDKGDVAELLKKLEEVMRRGATPSVKDNSGRTALHVSVIRNLPEEFIIAMIKRMDPSDINLRDKSGRTALDYLLDQDEKTISRGMFQAFVNGQADFTGGKGCALRNSPFMRLCRRRGDGHFLMDTVMSSVAETTWVLEEAVKSGSHSSVKLMLEKRADPNVKGKFLLHKAADANHENIAKVEALSHGGCDVSQEDQAGQTLLHKAAGGRPPRVELLQLALDYKIDPNKQDKKGDTALHKVATNYAGRSIECKQCVDVMRRLLYHQNIDPNIRNKQGLTPLQKLFTAKRDLPESVVLEWVQAGADFTGGDAVAGDSWKRSPLAMMATRKDGPKLFAALAAPLKGVITESLQLLLRAAVRMGTAEMVKLLLDKGANANEGEGKLLLSAAKSPFEAAAKIKLLHMQGAAPGYKGNRDYTALHVAAASIATSDDVLKACVNTLNLKLIDKDKSLNSPLHIAAMNSNPGSPTLVRYLAKRDLGGEPNRKNRFNETPLQLVLEGRKELRLNKLAFLLENGCQPTVEDLQGFEGDVEEFEDLFLSTEVIVKSQDPIRLLITLGQYCQEKYEAEKKNETNERSQNLVAERKKVVRRKSLKWLKLNEKLEQEAILMIDEFGKDAQVLQGVMTSDDIDDADNLEWNKLLANENIGRLLMQMFNGLVDASDAEADDHWWQKFGKRVSREKWYHFLDLILLFLLQSLFFPVYLLSFPLCCCYHRCGRNWGKDEFVGLLPINPQQLPIVTFSGSLIGYVIFLVFLTARIALGDNEGQFTWLDWVILVYIVAMVAEELYQIITRGLEYLGVANILDDLVVILFCVFYVVRGLGSALDSLPVLRASEHVFAISAALAFLRILYYLQIHRRLGPIQVSFKEITTEVISFLVILGVFLLSFGIAISGVYNAGIYTDLYRNHNVSLPQKFRGLWPSLQSMYWSLYGQVEYTELESQYDELTAETTVGLIVFALWSLVSVIVLLNMLIAVISEAFGRVKNDNADLVWHLAINRIVREIHDSPSFPLPINLFYLLGLLGFEIHDKIVHCCGENVCNETGRQDETDGGNDQRREITFTAIAMASRMTAAYNKKKQEQSFDKARSEMQQSLKDHSEQMKSQMASQLEVMRTRMQRQVTSQVKRVQKDLKRLPSVTSSLNRQESFSQGYAASERTERTSLYDASDSDSDDTDDELQDTDVRYERANVDGHIISYTGKGRQPGVCQLLRSPISRVFTYYEVTITDCGEKCAIGVGLAKRNYPLNQMPGWRVGSVAFHCHDGKLFHDRGYSEMMATPAQEGDVLGCGVDASSFHYDDTDDKVTVFFTRNRSEIGHTRVTYPKGGLFPTLGFLSEGEAVAVNLDAKWPPAEHKDEEAARRPARALRQTPNRLHFEDDGDILNYKSTLEGGVGIFQDLNYPISKESNYFEVTILDLGIRGAISIGVAPRHYPLDRMPGWNSGSIAYHCDDGVVLKGPAGGRLVFTPTDAKEVIGCGLQFSPGNTKLAKVFFTRNWKLFHESSADIPPGGFFPTIGLSSAGEEVKIDVEAKWPPRSTAVTASRWERVHIDGDLIEYVGDMYRNVGIFQSLSRPMNREFSYYEVEIIDYGKYGTIAVGLAPNDYPLHRQPGWDKGSVALHCNDGSVYTQGEKRELEPIIQGDVIGCGIDFKQSRTASSDGAVIFFTRNGEELTRTRVPVPKDGLYPTIGMHSDGETVRLNLSVVWHQSSSQMTDRSLGTEIASARVYIEGDQVAYVGDPYNQVGGVQLLSHPLSDLCRYYEVLVLDAGERPTICIGLARRGYQLDCQPGWVSGSIGYYCGDGSLYHDGNRHDFFRRSTTGALIGCGVREKTNKSGQSQSEVFFTHDGKELKKKVPVDVPARELYPCISMHRRGERVKVNPSATWHEVGSKSLPNADLFLRAERVRIKGKTVEYAPDTFGNVGAVQIDRQMSENFAYYEIEIIACGNEGAIGVGLARKDYPLDCQPGWAPGSIGFHSDDGSLFTGDGFGRPFSTSNRQRDVLGCGIDYTDKKSKENTVMVFFTRNRELLETKTEVPVPVGGFYPTVGMHSKGDVVKVNSKAAWPPKKDGGFRNPLADVDELELTSLPVKTD